MKAKTSKKETSQETICQKCKKPVLSQEEKEKIDRELEEEQRKKEEEGMDAEGIIDDFDADDGTRRFSWPQVLPERERKIPDASPGHLKRIAQLWEEKMITDNRVRDAMQKLDFQLFYYNISDEWVEHNCVMLQRTVEKIKEGYHVLVLQYNTYFSICLSLMLGPKGAVICFGHSGNENNLKKHHLEWLEDDYRVVLRNKQTAIYFGKAFQKFQEQGWQYMSPYDLIVMSDAPLTDKLKSQLKPGCLAFRPDTGDIIYTQD